MSDLRSRGNMRNRWLYVAISPVIKAILCILIFVIGTLNNSIAETIEGEPKLEIQSSAFILKIDKVAGGLVHLIDKESGNDLLALVDQPAKLFEIAGEDAWFTNNAEALSSINITHSGTEQILAIEYEFKTSAGSLFVSVHIKADSQQPDIEFDIDLKNRAKGLIIESIRFPVIDVKRQLDDSKTDMAFIPGGEGAVIRGIRIDDTWGVKDYPGSGSMQFTAYYNDNVGIGLECHDTNGEPKRIGYFHNSSYGPESVHIVCTHLTAYEPNAEIAKYPIVLFPVKGSWHVAAEHYKQWALKQWWSKPKPQEMKRPEWTYKNPIVIESDLRPQYCGLRAMPLDRYSEILSAWNDLFGGSARLLPLHRGFARYGTYVSPHYFPLYPDEVTLEKVFSDTHSAGHYSMAMVTGMIWMKKREELISGAAHWVEGFDGMVENENGEMIDGWTDVTPPGTEVCVVTKEGKVFESYEQSWVGNRSQMCPGHPYTKQVLVKLAKKMGELGLDLFLLDQMNGGRSKPCYSQEHGHPLGAGPWAAKAIADLMAAAKKAGRAKNPDFTLSLEDPGELWLPYLDIVGFRPAAVNGWPAPSVSSELAHGDIEPFSYTVPAFAYVYGSLARPQTWDIRVNSNHSEHRAINAQKAALELARTFASGTAMALGIGNWMLVDQYAPPPEGWSHEKDPPDEPYGSMYPSDAIAQLPDRVYDPHLKLLRNTVMIAGGPALEYLNHGAMIMPPRIESPTVAFVVWSWDNEAKRGIERKWQDYAIHYNAWKLKDGSIALLLTNADLENAHSISLPVEFGGVNIGKAWSVRIHRNSENGIACEDRYISNGEDKSITIQPCEALMIEYTGPDPD
ncbi:DUF6259 domain-containing protein [Candidatus Poribacteria bacterium]